MAEKAQCFICRGIVTSMEIPRPMQFLIGFPLRHYAVRAGKLSRLSVFYLLATLAVLILPPSAHAVRTSNRVPATASPNIRHKVIQTNFLLMRFCPFKN